MKSSFSVAESEAELFTGDVSSRQFSPVFVCNQAPLKWGCTLSRKNLSLRRKLFFSLRVNPIEKGGKTIFDIVATLAVVYIPLSVHLLCVFRRS